MLRILGLRGWRSGGILQDDELRATFPSTRVEQQLPVGIIGDGASADRDRKFNAPQDVSVAPRDDQRTLRSRSGLFVVRRCAAGGHGCKERRHLLSVAPSRRHARSCRKRPLGCNFDHVASSRPNDRFLTEALILVAVQRTAGCRGESVGRPGNRQGRGLPVTRCKRRTASSLFLTVGPQARPAGHGRLPVLVDGRFGAAQFGARVGRRVITMSQMSASASISGCQVAAGRGYRQSAISGRSRLAAFE